MAYLFVLMLVMLSVGIIVMHKAVDFLAWMIEVIKTKLNESKKGVVEEETEPL